MAFGDEKSNLTGSNPPVLAVGDSLFVNAGHQNIADLTRFFTGRSTYVSAAAGASYSHYVTPSLLAGERVSTVQDLVGFLRPPVTVLALGTNDGRLLAIDAGNPNGYTQADFQGSANTAISAATSVSGCTILVNITTRPQTPESYRVQAATINAYLAGRASAGRVRVADWNGLSINRPDWFDAKDSPYFYHHSAAGQDAYRKFIYDQVNAGC